jgi:cytochrome P450
MIGKEIQKFKGNTIFGAGNALRKNPLKFIIDMNKTYPGGIVHWKLLHRDIVLLNDPILVRDVLQTNQKHYIKNYMYDKLKLLLGLGLLTSEGQLWKKQRKMIQPSFHKQHINNLFDEMLHCTNEMIKDWKVEATNEGKIDFAPEMMKVTLQIIAKTMLSADFKMEAKSVGVSLTYLLKAIEEKVFQGINFPLWVPTQANIEFKSKRKVLDKLIFKLISERRKTGQQKGDLLDMLMGSRYEDNGEAMPDNLLRDELMTIFLAGHETTANALTWTFYLLAKHPEVYQKLKKEVKEVVGDGELTFQHLHQLKFTKACINESMRLFPPVWLFGRRATEDNMVGDYLIMKDTSVLISPYIVHRNADYWKNPEVFNPERWDTEEVKQMDKFAYFPFAAGPRMCIGNNFALLEADIILTKVIQQFDFNYIGESEPVMDPTLTLRVKDGMPMQIKNLF